MDDRHALARDKAILWAAIALVAFFAFRTISHGDFWIHLASGRLLSESGWVKTEPFSFATDITRVWVNPTWLFDWVLYRLWRLNPSLPTLFTAFGALTAFGLAAASARSLGAGWLSISSVVLLSAWLAAPAFRVDPLVVAAALTALFMRVCQRAGPREALAVLFPAQIIWTNLHPSFLAGPLIAACYAVRPRPEKPPLKFWVPLALALATLLNPYGFRLLRWALAIHFHSNFNVSLDWISPFAGEFGGSLERWLQPLLLIIVIAGFVFVQGRLPFPEVLLASAGGFVLMLAPQSGLLAGLLAIPFASTAVEAIGQTVASRFERGRRLTLEAVARGMLAAALLLSVFAIVSNWYYSRSGHISSFGLGIANDTFPQQACQQALKRPDFPRRALNLAQDGGYIVWSVPDRKIFVDTRVTIFGASFYRGLSRALLGEAEIFGNLIRDFQPGAIVLNTGWLGAGQALRRLLESPDWRLVYFDGLSAVVARNTPENAALLADDRLQRVGLVYLEAARRAFAAHIERFPFPPQNNPRLIGAANVFLSLNRYAEAEALLRLIVRGSPSYRKGPLQLGIALVQQGRSGEAIPYLERAVRVERGNPLPLLWLAKAHQDLGHLAEHERLRQSARRIDPKIVDRFDLMFRTGGDPLQKREAQPTVELPGLR